jgi:hypothetical protein
MTVNDNKPLNSSRNKQLVQSKLLGSSEISSHERLLIDVVCAVGDHNVNTKISVNNDVTILIIASQL